MAGTAADIMEVTTMVEAATPAEAVTDNSLKRRTYSRKDASASKNLGRSPARQVGDGYGRAMLGSCLRTIRRRS